jgi:A/G-specific adenine glycosylase
MEIRPPSPEVRRVLWERLLPWYDAHRRDLPWRRTRDPYAVAVSEFMCQQTQVATVVPYFERWMAAFPDWQALAAAPEARVLKAWEGLGYYRRARLLHQLARTVANSSEGELPQTPKALRALPGIGPYMAGAIASIAFQQPVPLVDGNVERVLARLHAFAEPTKSAAAQKQFWAWAEALVPEERPGDHNQALMELGARICTPRSPACLICPLSSGCAGKTAPERYPVIERPPTLVQQRIYAVVLQRRRIWLLHPQTPGLWKGLHRLPEFDPAWMEVQAGCGQAILTITRHRIRAERVAARPLPGAKPPPTGAWHAWPRLAELTLPAPHRRILEAVAAQCGHPLPS